MALVKINIPGIGEVTAENAASEDTLLRLLAAMEKSASAKSSGASTKTGGADPVKSAKDLIESKKKETEATDDSAKAVKSATKGTDDYTKSQKKSTESLVSLQKAWDGMKPGLGQAGGALVDFAGSLVGTASSLVASFATAYDDMVKNPIGTAAKLVNTGLDLVGSAAKTTSDVFFGTAKAIGGQIPIIGGAVSGFVDGLNAAAKAAIDLAITLAKSANEVFAKEFQKSVDALKSYTAQGASFAGGMDEMRIIANKSGLSLQTLQEAAKLASADLNAMGLSQGDGVKKLASGMAAAAKTIGKSGGSLRDEMLGLGYSYAEQGSLMAQYMSQQKANGALEKMTTEQIARGTADYAKNLKVISDITGQDAKKLMEKSRAESQRGALMNKLQGDSKEAFGKAYATLSKYGPEVQAALVQQLAGGEITDAKIAANQDLSRMVKEIAANVQSGQGDIVESTVKSMGEARERLAKNGDAAALDAVAVMSNGGAQLASAMSSITNNILASGITPEMAERSNDAAEAQMTATDKTTKAYEHITKAAEDAAVVMETMVSKNLGTYAETLADSYVKAQQLFVKGIEAMQQMLNGTLFNGGGEAKVKTADSKATVATKAEDKAYKDASFLQKLGIGSTDEQKAASRERVQAVQTQYQAQIADPEAAVKAAQQAAKETREQGKANGEILATISSFLHGEGFAKGGIASGPKSGYPAVLHGTEAVIPLEGGKKVPIDISSIDSAAAMASGPSDFADSLAKVASMITPKGPSLPSTSGLPDAKSLDTNLTNALGEQFDKLSNFFVKDSKAKDDAAQQKSTNTKSDNTEQLLSELKELMSSQLAKHDEMIDKLSQTVDINQRLLNQAYS